MPLGNSHTRYGSVSRLMHWLTALVILAAIPLGLLANRLPYATDAEIARTFLLFSAHKTLGIAALALGLARLAWMPAGPRPAPLHPDRRIETFLALGVHWTLSLGLVVVPLAGWVSHAATPGLAPIWWPLGQSLPFVPQNPMLAETAVAIHRAATKLLGAALLLHIAGAAKHGLIDRDATLSRMTTGAEAGPGVPASQRYAFRAAAGLWALALIAGLALGYFSVPDGGEKAREWPFAKGEIALLDPSGARIGTATAFGFVLNLAPDGKGTLDISFPVDAVEGDTVAAALAAIPFPLLQFNGTISGTPPQLAADGMLDAGGIAETGVLRIDLSGLAAHVTGTIPVPGVPGFSVAIDATATRP